VVHAAGAVLAFHLAYGSASLNGLIVGYAYCLIQLARTSRWRLAFYPGIVVGLLIVGPKLQFFWTIFGPSVIALWLILAIWIGLFVGIAWLCFARLGTAPALIIVPFLWLGLEYFRSELYFLRFSWLNIGYAFSDQVRLLPMAKLLGMYGVGFAVTSLAAGLACLRPLRAGLAGVVLVAATVLAATGNTESPGPVDRSGKGVEVAGVQLEFPSESEVIRALNKLVEASPEAELLVLSEYTFQNVVPERVKGWCRDRRLHLIVGGTDPIPGGDFYNTAFVVGPAGDVVFRQVKSVPIQFFKDGLPAPELRPWDSPWGKIGICICYDLSYTRVTDRLVRQGAEALIVPTMDVLDWGERQHEMHARVAPVRAAEYGLPIFRIASSGISQLVDRSGRRVDEAGFACRGATISGWLPTGKAGTLPWDRWLAPVAIGMSAGLILFLLVMAVRKRLLPVSTPGSDPDPPV
jgi:apolipoprotein N-acyltransferase